MINNQARRITGIAMIGMAAASLIISLFLFIQVWRWKDPLEQGIQSMLEMLSEIIETTSQALIVTNSSLDTAATNLSNLEDLTLTLTNSVNRSSQVVASVATLVGDDLPLTLQNAQTAIVSAQTSAGVIEDVLKMIARIPLIGISYNPPLPLDDALGNVAESLDNMPTALEDIQNELEATSTDLLDLETELLNLTGSILLIQANLELVRDVIAEYQAEVREMQTRLDQAQEAIPGLIDRLAWVCSFAILWLAVAQIGLLVQGINLFIINPQKTGSERVESG